MARTKVDLANQTVGNIPESRVSGLTADLAALIPESIIKAKGDLVVGISPTTASGVGVGLNGKVLTADSSQPSGLSWTTPASSSGQHLYDAIVAPTGGDYSDIQTALTALGSNATIFIAPGTYTITSTINVTGNNVTIIGSGIQTIVNIGANSVVAFNVTGNDVTIRNLQISGHKQSYTGTRGIFGQTGISRLRVINCYIHDLKGEGVIQDTNTGNQILDNVICDNVGENIQLASCNGVIVSGNYLYVSTNDVTYGTIDCQITIFSSHNCLFNDNVLDGNASGGAGVGYGIEMGGNTEMWGNTFSDNVVQNVYYPGIYIWNDSSAGSHNNVVSGNTFRNCGTQAINLFRNAKHNIITGNNIENASISSNGAYAAIEMTSDDPLKFSDYNVITNNYVYDHAANKSNGISETGAQSNHSLITGNVVRGSLASITTVGDQSQAYNNVVEIPYYEKKLQLMKNTSGGTVNKGSIVILKSVANGFEYTTTTTLGDVKVYGMVAEDTTNNSYGLVQVLGKTTYLKANGTTAISIGDYLSTYSSAGIVKKASAGDTVIAIALEAYSTADSNGVLDALIISPFSLASSSSGTVTTLSVASANGFAGSVTNPTTTPQITVSTTASGILKGNSTSIAPAVANVDYLTPTGNGSQLTGMTESQIANLTTDLAAKAAEVSITGATKTKITYNADGIVTAGADATTADIADSTNKRYVTDAQQTVLGNTSGTNTGDQTLASSVVSETGYGQSSAVGTSTNVARQDHTHGTPTAEKDTTAQTGILKGNGSTITVATDADITGKVLTGYVSGAGTVAATDTILQAIQKLNANDATNANLTGPITSVGNATSVASQTGTGTKFVMDTSPVLVTPTIGVATATSINKMAITAPATGSTLAVADGKTFTVSNTITLAGTDGTTITLPSTTGTVALNNQTFFIGTTSVAINRASASLTLAGITLTTPNIGAATGTSLAATGAITSSGGGIGYATGAGGTVSQATSKSTAFTLSKLTGTITTPADALAANTNATATWTNTQIAATDIVIVQHQSGGTLGAYNITVTPAAGSATLVIRNITGGSLSEALVIRFAVIKAVAA